jgi:hypothetical protein
MQAGPIVESAVEHGFGLADYVITFGACQRRLQLFRR